MYPTPATGITPDFIKAVTLANDQLFNCAYLIRHHAVMSFLLVMLAATMGFVFPINVVRTLGKAQNCIPAYFFSVLLTNTKIGKEIEFMKLK